MDRGKLVRTLREMRARLQEHEREARALRRDLRVIREAAGGSVGPPGQRRRGRRPRRPVEPSPTSPLGRALAVLRASRQPMRIEHILRAIGRTTGGKVKRRTVESQLSRYVRKGRLVCRTGPAEFAVLKGEGGPGVRRRPQR